MNRSLLAIAGTIALFATAAVAGCGDNSTLVSPAQGSNALLKVDLSAPTLTIVGQTETTITVRVTAGAQGAPAGFSIQWELTSEYQSYGWDDALPSYCAASFSGNARDSRFDLGPGEYADVILGITYTENGASGGCGPLVCGTSYSIRGFAHGDNENSKSDFTSTITASTSACPTNCVLGLGDWKNASSWPGGHSRTDAWFGSSTETWGSMINKAPAGDKDITLAHDYISTKLNICNGATPNAAIIAALQTAYNYFSGTITLTKDQKQDLHQAFMTNKDLMTCSGGGSAYCP